MLFFVTATDSAAVEYLKGEGVLVREKICYKCKALMIYNQKKFLFECRRKGHRVVFSIFKETFFENNKIGVANVLKISYLYLHKVSTVEISKMTGIGTEAITAWCLYLRELLADSLEFSEIQIGGEGIVVEVDETKLGKRKYNRGRLVEGTWVVGGIERTPEKRCFYVEVKGRTSNTIYSVLSNFILPCFIVYTDCFKSYIPVCKELNFNHLTVNHTKNFVDPITGAHTNTIEGLNNGLKTIIKPRNRTKKNINSWLFYFIFRRNNRKNIWSGFINALKNIKYIN